MPALAIDGNYIRRFTCVNQVEYHATLPSTNDHALLLAQQPCLETPYLIIAGEQTAGRGRGANRWWSRPGALTFSLVLNPQTDRFGPGSAELPADQWPRIALVAGLALCESLERLLPHVPCRLKWPNDVLVGGRKLAGILVEIPPAPPGVARRLVLGMGVNVNNSLSQAPPEIQEVGTSLCDVTGCASDPTSLLVEWLVGFAGNLQLLASGDPGLSRRWQALCALTGQTVELALGDRRVRGLCRGIAVDGALLLDCDHGPERVYGGVLVRIV